MTGLPDGQLVLLDTNIVMHLCRASEIGEWIDDELELRQRPERPILSKIVVGECLAAAKKWKWGEPRQRLLSELLREFPTSDIGAQNILNAYAEIDFYCEKEMKPARPIGQNDMWIAATATAAQAVLVTTDKDFDHLHEKFFTRIYVDVKQRTIS